ncbi:chlorophyll A-B binding protein [Aureococcus anophagefferens]|nr:chlorophyll A-B binding protein [Aureococcus anophagefferens]
MKLALLALSLAPAAAYVAPAASAPSKVVMQETKADLEAMAKELNPIVGFYDPLGLSSASFWGKSEAETIGFLRHSEIKHGRVAMAAFSGYCIQANGIHFPWTPFRGFEESVSSMTPPEQWDAIPVNAKLQIIAWVGFLEFYSEIAGTHYMKGGVPGKFPSFKETAIANILPWTSTTPRRRRRPCPPGRPHGRLFGRSRPVFGALGGPEARARARPRTQTSARRSRGLSVARPRATRRGL